MLIHTQCDISLSNGTFDSEATSSAGFSSYARPEESIAFSQKDSLLEDNHIKVGDVVCFLPRDVEVLGHARYWLSVLGWFEKIEEPDYFKLWYGCRCVCKRLNVKLGVNTVTFQVRLSKNVENFDE